VVEVEVGDQDHVEPLERRGPDRADEPTQRADPRLRGRVSQESDAVEIDPDAGMAQELDRGGRRGLG
jgi:hypothetical protein